MNGTVTTTRTLVNGDTLTSTSAVHELASDTTNLIRERIDIKTVLDNTKKELADFIHEKYNDDAGQWVEGYDIGDGVRMFTVINDVFETEIFVHESHIAIKEYHAVTSGYNKINIEEEYYILYNEDGILTYQPKETNVYMGPAECSYTKKCKLVDNNPSTSISVNFEAGYTHAFTVLPSPADGTSIKRYVGSNNEDPIVYRDIKSECEKNGQIIKETETYVFLDKDVPGDTVVEVCEEYSYDKED